MTTIPAKKNNYAELAAISTRMVERIDDLLEIFDIVPNKFPNRYTFACPVHGGDNATACSIFTSGSKIVGNWKCFTHMCDDTYGKGIIGFVRGILSQKYNREVSFGEAVKWAKAFVGNVTFEESFEAPHKSFISITDYINKNETDLEGHQSKSEFRKKIIIPADYYIKRGYKSETMQKFDVGLCLEKGNRFFSRIVVPVYDDSGMTVVGSVARTTQPLCKICNKYHFENRPCPQNKLEEIWAEKWLNSTGFKKSACLYNYWHAKPYIDKSGHAVLVEGQGDVWRLDEAGIYNGLGMFGCELSDDQMIILEKTGAMTLWVLTDNDGPGIEAREKIRKKCGRMYNIKFIDLQNKDIGDTPINEVKELLRGATKDFSHKW